MPGERAPHTGDGSPSKRRGGPVWARVRSARRDVARFTSPGLLVFLQHRPCSGSETPTPRGSPKRHGQTTVALPSGADEVTDQVTDQAREGIKVSWPSPVRPGSQAEDPRVAGCCNRDPAPRVRPSTPNPVGMRMAGRSSFRYGCVDRRARISGAIRISLQLDVQGWHPGCERDLWDTSGRHCGLRVRSSRSLFGAAKSRRGVAVKDRRCPAARVGTTRAGLNSRGPAQTVLPNQNRCVSCWSVCRILTTVHLRCCRTIAGGGGVDRREGNPGPGAHSDRNQGRRPWH